MASVAGFCVETLLSQISVETFNAGRAGAHPYLRRCMDLALWRHWRNSLTVSPKRSRVRRQSHCQNLLPRLKPGLSSHGSSGQGGTPVILAEQRAGRPRHIELAPDLAAQDLRVARQLPQTYRLSAELPFDRLREQPASAAQVD